MTEDMKESLKMIHDDIRNRHWSIGAGYNIIAEDSEWFYMLRPYCECGDDELRISIMHNVANILREEYYNVHEEFIETVQLWRGGNEDLEVCV